MCSGVGLPKSVSVPASANPLYRATVASAGAIGRYGRGVDLLRPGHGISIPASSVEWTFTPSGGPGGQHANRSNTRVEARLDLRTVTGVAEQDRARLRAKLGDEVRVSVDGARSQYRNRMEALERLEQQLSEALIVPRRRRATKPTAGARRRRIDAKRRRGSVKKMRCRPGLDD